MGVFTTVLRPSFHEIFVQFWDILGDTLRVPKKELIKPSASLASRLYTEITGNVAKCPSAVVKLMLFHCQKITSQGLEEVKKQKNPVLLD